MILLLGIFDDPHYKIAPLPAAIIVIIVVFFLFGLSRRRHTSKNSTKGVVRQFTASSEIQNHYNVNNMNQNRTIQVWRFLLERFDENGNQLPFTTVEMKAKRFVGFIAEGHTVEIFDKIKSGQLSAPKKVYNHTANALVKAK